MIFWPHDTFVMETDLTPHEVVEVLKEHVEPTKWMRLTHSHATFQGDVRVDGFTITRIIHYRNSFLPVVTGTFLPARGKGIQLHIRMSLSSWVKGFGLFWGCAVMWMFSTAILFGEREEEIPGMIYLIPFGMVAFLFGLMHIGFWPEARKQKRMLVEMFHGKEQSLPS